MEERCFNAGGVPALLDPSPQGPPPPASGGGRARWLVVAPGVHAQSKAVAQPPQTAASCRPRERAERMLQCRPKRLQCGLVAERGHSAIRPQRPT